MGGGTELLTLGVLFVIAYGLGRLGKLVGLPAIPIYMIVGLLASPHTAFFPLSFKAADVELVATFGLILLLFNLGLEFDQDAFFENAGRLIASGAIRIGVNMIGGFGLGLLFGWGTREALIIAGMTATSSSAIITKMLIELQRLANRETPLVLGIAVLEDIFVAIYLAIVSVIISGKTDPGPIVLQLVVSFLFLIVMFAIARWGGRVVSRLVQTRDTELFTILFFGLAVVFAGLGELIGVSDAIGAFLIGLVLGASRFRERIEGVALPLRDVFAAFFFLNFGLSLDIRQFGTVLIPVAAAVLMTLVLNTGTSQLIARINGLSQSDGVNVSAILQNRGEFALILATLAAGAGLDARLTSFAGLYVLVMAIIGPILTVNSERIGRAIFGRRRAPVRTPDAGRDLELALAEAAMQGQQPTDTSDSSDEDVDAPPDVDTPPDIDTTDDGDADDGDELDRELEDAESRRRARQAGEQSDSDARRAGVGRERDPEY